jgi:hypothetical protein
MDIVLPMTSQIVFVSYQPIPPLSLNHPKSEEGVNPEVVHSRNSCTKCRTNKSPMWRAGPVGKHTLCNACGQSFKKAIQRRDIQKRQFNARIPVSFLINGTERAMPHYKELIEKFYRLRSAAAISPGMLHAHCFACGKNEKSQWRRGPDGQGTLCNACGLAYAMLMKKRIASA